MEVIFLIWGEVGRWPSGAAAAAPRITKNPGSFNLPLHLWPLKVTRGCRTAALVITPVFQARIRRKGRSSRQGHLCIMRKVRAFPTELSSDRTVSRGHPTFEKRREQFCSLRSLYWGREQQPRIWGGSPISQPAGATQVYFHLLFADEELMRTLVTQSHGAELGRKTPSAASSNTHVASTELLGLWILLQGSICHEEESSKPHNNGDIFSVACFWTSNFLLMYHMTFLSLFKNHYSIFINVGNN